MVLGHIDTLHYTLTSTFPHHSSLFTQGLQYYSGYLYESGGNYGQSTIQIVHPDTGYSPEALCFIPH